MGWERPILTDSGGFQVFSLVLSAQDRGGGCSPSSPTLTARRIFMGPEESMRIQSHLASTIAMAFDECIENPATTGIHRTASIARTRCAGWNAARQEMERLNSPARDHQQEPAALWHQPGFYLMRICAHRAYEGDRSAGSGRLCHRRSGCGGDSGGDVPDHRAP